MRTRIRTVKPELFLHEELAEIEQQSGLPLRLLFIGLFLVADREGRFPWRPRAIKALLFPYEDVPVGEAMNWLFYYDFIRRYVADGRQWGYIPTFTQHQQINHREAASTCPEPTGANTDDPDTSLAPGVQPELRLHVSHETDPGAPLTDVPATVPMPPPVIGRIAPQSDGGPEDGVGKVRDANERKEAHSQRRERYVEVVFLYWRERLGKTGRTVLDKKRAKRISDRLDENDDDVRELLCAVDGALKDEFLMGRSPRGDGRRYDGVEQIFRDRGQIEHLAPQSDYWGEAVHPFMRAKQPTQEQ